MAPNRNRNQRRQGGPVDFDTPMTDNGSAPHEQRRQRPNKKGGNAANSNNGNTKPCKTHPNAKHSDAECNRHKKANGNTDDRRNGENGQNGNNKRNCGYCQQTGHQAENCRHNPMSKNFSDSGLPNQQLEVKTNFTNNAAPSTQTESKVNTVPYCHVCNSTLHTFKSCRNDEALVAWRDSVLFCTTCKHRAHLSQQCNNPLFERCTTCQSIGHHPSECRLKRLSDAANLRVWATTNKNNNNGFTFPAKNLTLTESQRMIQNWEKYKAECIESGEYPSQAFCQATEAQIRAKAKDDRIYVHKEEQAAVKPITGPAVSAAPILKVQGYSSQELQKAQRYLDGERNRPLNTLREAARQKCNNSCYPVFSANADIRRAEQRILHDNVLSRVRMDEVKHAMLQGAQFFRDPKAMEALFSRTRPCCEQCDQMGNIFDRYFNVVDHRVTTKEIFLIEDFNDWGLFVGLPCQCGVRRQGSELRPNYHYKSVEPLENWRDEWPALSYR